MCVVKLRTYDPALRKTMMSYYTHAVRYSHGSMCWLSLVEAVRYSRYCPSIDAAGICLDIPPTATDAPRLYRATPMTLLGRPLAYDQNGDKEWTVYLLGEVT